MIIYLACLPSTFHLKIVKEGKGENILVSYYNLQGKHMPIEELKTVWGIKNLFIDSGAFSAWTQNKPLDVDKYIKFIYDNKKFIDEFASLDDCRLNRKISARNSKKNYLIMKKAGLNPMPVWHLGEDIKLLHFYNEQASYIGVGGIALPKLNTSRLGEVLKRNVKKGTRIHLFGITRRHLLLSYPCYSLDTTSWILHSAYGGVLLYKDGNIKAHKVRSPQAMAKHFKQFQKMSGFTMAEVSKLSERRGVIAVLSFKLYEKFLTEVWKKRGIEWKT